MSSSSSSTNNARAAAVQCSNCNKTGHTAEMCYGPGGGRDRTKNQSAFFAGDGYLAADGGGLSDDDRGVIESIGEAEEHGDGDSTFGFLLDSLSTLNINVPSINPSTATLISLLTTGPTT